MKRILRFALRLLFLPLGALMLGLTAAFEFMCEFPNWSYWRRQNEFVLEAMWLKRRAGNGSADPS